MWNLPTKEQLARIPRLGSQLENPELETNDIMIYLHFFVGSCDWWIAEYDGDDLFYGFACLGDPQMAEWGSISFAELQELTIWAAMTNGRNGETIKIPVQVDCELHWTPQRFGDIARVRQILAAPGRD